MDPESLVTFGGAVRMLREARGLSLAGLASRANVSKAHLGNTENGKRHPSDHVVRAIDEALRADGLLIELAGEGDEMRRRALVSLLAGLPLAQSGSLDRLLAGMGTGTPPAHVGMSDVAAVDQAHALCTDLDLRYGGGVAAGMSRSTLSWSVKLLDQSMSDGVRRRLSSAVGVLADRVAWAHFDAGFYNHAKTLFALARTTADRGEDPNLTAHVLLNTASLATHLGRSDEAVSVLSLALEQRHLTNAIRSNLHAAYARHLAHLGKTTEVERHLGLSHAAQSAATTEDTPAWSRSFLANGHLDRVRAWAMLTAGKYADAIETLDRALPALDRGRGRGLAHGHVWLSTAYAKAGYPDAAKAPARKALSLCAGIRSSRVRQDLVSLSRLFQQAHQPDLAHEVSRTAEAIKSGL